MATLEETNKNLGALVLVTKDLVESREEEKKDASFFDVPSPSGEPGDAVDSEGNKLVLSKAGNLMQAGADGKATVMSPIGATSKAPNIPSMALPRMGDAGRAGQAEDEAEGTTEPDEKKRNSLLSKMTGFLADQAKEKGKIAKLGIKGFFGTLIFGGFLIALGEFLQSDTFKKATEFIDKTLIPKLKEFYNAFFGPEGGLFKGIMTLFGDESGIGAIVAGIAGVTALMGVAALKALFSPLTLGLGLLFKGIRGLGRMIPRVPGAPAGGGERGGGSPGTDPGKGDKPNRKPTRRPSRGGGRFGKLLNIGKFLADKAKKLVTSGGAKTVAKVAGTAAVAGAAVATTRAPTKIPKVPAAAPSAPSKIPTAGAPKASAAGAPKAPAGAKPINPLQKFPKVGKFLGVAKRIPGLSAIFAISDLISIFGNDDLSTKAKIAAGVGVFGGLGASILGGALGMMFGGPIGAGIGGLVGYFGGEMLATGLMQWMLGETVDAFPDSWFLPDINGWMNGSGGAKTGGGGGSDAKMTGTPKASAVGAGSSKASPNLKIQAAAKANFQKQASIEKQASSDIAALGKPMTVVGREKHGFREEIMGFKDPEKQAQLEKLQKQQKDAQIKKRQAAQKFAAAEIGGQGGTFKYGGKRTTQSDVRKIQLLLEHYTVGELQAIAPEQLTDNFIEFGGNRFPLKVLGFYENWLKERLETKPTPAPAAGGPAASGAGDVGTGIPMSMPGDAAPTPAAALVDSKGKPLTKGMLKKFAGLPEFMRTQEFANFIPTPLVDKNSLNRKSLETAKREYKAAIERGDVVDPRSKEQLAALKEGQQLVRSNMPGGGTPKKANIAQNKVGPQTADLTAAIARKMAMSGDSSTAAAATQQGGGNTQITNVTKKDGDVTHMPKSDIRNNKFAALTGSRLYPAGAI